MGGYGTWNAAIRVFAYPESYLLPELRPLPVPPAPPQPLDQTAAYQQLMTDLRNEPRLTPPRAQDLADRYHQKLAGDLGGDLPPAVRPDALTITETLTDSQLADRREFIREQFFTDITDPAKAPNYVQEIFYFVPLALALQLQRSGQYLVALDWIETFYTDHFAAGERKIYHGLVLEETIPTAYQRNPDNWLRVGLNPHEIATARGNAHTRFTLMTLARCYLDFADAEFTRDEGESIARARALYQAALALLALPEMEPPGTGSEASPFPPNPVPEALKRRGELNLFKLRSGRNIAGIERQATGVAQPSQTLDRLPVAGGPQRPFRPTPYRYTALIERAKNLVSIAQQVEQAFLAALEKRDAEVYNLLKAGHDLQIAGAVVDVHGLQVKEAEQGIGLAERQLDRAATAARHLSGLDRCRLEQLGDQHDRRTHHRWGGRPHGGGRRCGPGRGAGCDRGGLRRLPRDRPVRWPRRSCCGHRGGVRQGGSAGAADRRPDHRRGQRSQGQLRAPQPGVAAATPARRG